MELLGQLKTVAQQYNRNVVENADIRQLFTETMAVDIRIKCFSISNSVRRIPKYMKRKGAQIRYCKAKNTDFVGNENFVSEKK